MSVKLCGRREELGKLYASLLYSSDGRYAGLKSWLYGRPDRCAAAFNCEAGSGKVAPVTATDFDLEVRLPATLLGSDVEV